MVFEPTHYLSAFEILMWIADLIEAAVVQRLKQRIPECFALTNLTQASQGLRQYDVYLNYHSLNLTSSSRDKNYNPLLLSPLC